MEKNSTCFSFGDEMKISISIISILLFFSVIKSFKYMEYKKIKKYYPDLTFWEYGLLEDKIRIIPVKESEEMK